MVIADDARLSAPWSKGEDRPHLPTIPRSTPVNLSPPTRLRIAYPITFNMRAASRGKGPPKAHREQQMSGFTILAQMLWPLLLQAASGLIHD